MSPRIITLVFTACLLVGCTPWVNRGHFAYLVPVGSDIRFEILSQTRLEGGACYGAAAYFGGGDDAYEEATLMALSKWPAAQFLAEVEMVDHGSCVEVTGLPAKAAPNKSTQPTTDETHSGSGE